MSLLLTVPNRIEEIHQALETVASWLDTTPDSDWARPLALLAIEELGTNFAKYAHPDGRAGTLSIQLSLKNHTRFEAAFEDHGIPFNPLLHTPPDTGAPLATREPGGLGIPLLRKWSDGIEYQRVGNANRLQLWKTRP